MARKRKEEPPVDITLPITPMLDMSFQLLSFFILTFKPMPTEGQLAINLPRLDASKTQQDLPLHEEPKQDEYRLTVHAGGGGEITNMSLVGPTVTKENIRTFQELEEQLKLIAKPAGRGAEGVSITIEASQDLIYSRLIDIMDRCKKAGYESVNLMPLGKERAG
ncbi:MAG TPA: biopolymer transporter ExbD [Gemmataceae bacterium]|nr:biopolymer transporter ExbD [Gemmataceae bacterium]